MYHHFFPFFSFLFQLPLPLCQIAMSYAFEAELFKQRDGALHLVFCATQLWRWCTWHMCPIFLLFKFFFHSSSFLLLNCLGPTSWHTHAILLMLHLSK